MAKKIRFCCLGVSIFILLVISKSWAVPVGDIEFNPLIPGAIDALFVNNFTGNTVSGGSALPPDFPVTDFLTFRSASLTIQFADGTSTVTPLGDIAPGPLFPPSALQFLASQAITSVSFTGLLNSSSFLLADGTTFTADPLLTGMLLPSTGSTLNAGTDLVILDAQAPVAPVPEPSSLVLIGTGLIGSLFFCRKRRNIQRTE